MNFYQSGMWAYEKLWRLPAFSGSGFSPLRLRSIPLRGTAPQGLQSLADCRTCFRMNFSQIKKSCVFTGFYSRLSDLNQVFWSQLPVASRQTPPTFAVGGLHAAFSLSRAHSGGWFKNLLSDGFLVNKKILRLAGL